jgi:hypothetical protein
MTNQDTQTEVTRKKVAEHNLIDAGKNVVDTEEEARGIRYTLLENGETFEWLADEASPAELNLLAIFGAKTLATNETSQARNNPKGSASADEQIAAVRDRFALIRDGKWVDRSREGGVGTRINKDALAEAICIVLVNAKKKTDADVSNGYKATVRDRLESDAEWLAKVRKQPDVAAEYARLAGSKATTSIDDLMV